MEIENATNDVPTAQFCFTLPAYDTALFWCTVESTQISLEVLTHCVRVAVVYADLQGRNRLIEIILARIERESEQWAYRLLNYQRWCVDESTIATSDLCADLYERVIRALIDPTRLFWEENFRSCLLFERKHVYHQFMIREGYWREGRIAQGDRIPRSLVMSLERGRRKVKRDGYDMEDVEDEWEQGYLPAVEQPDLLHLVQSLPADLKIVVLLIFWEGRTEREAAALLHVTDRTVRNRMRRALNLLRAIANSSHLQITGRTGNFAYDAYCIS